MEAEIIDSDTARNSAPVGYDKARHPLTIADAVELFAECGTPRSKRSVQRFCEQGHLDCVRIKGPRGDQFFINRESVVRYAEELRQIEAIAAFGDEARHDAPQHAAARNSAPVRDITVETITPTPQQEPDKADTVRRLKDENLNLRIDNRAKETVIAELNRRLNEDRDKFVSAMQDMSYKLGAAETRLAQIEAPKVDSDTARQSVPERDTENIEPPTAPIPTETVPAAPAETPAPKLRRSFFFGRLFR
ncbi:MAG: hypothetical protein AB7H90_05200 [Alphaproteobacteria bacterium]